MKFTSKTAEEPKELTAKFYFVGGDESSGIELRLVTDEDKEAARKKFLKIDTEFGIRPDTGKLEKVKTPEVNTKGLNEWYIDRIIVDFWGIILDDKPFECTTENKIALYNGYRMVDGKKIILDEDEVFNKFLNKCHGELVESSIESFGGLSLSGN